MPPPYSGSGMLPPYSGSGMPPFDYEMMDKLIDFSEGKIKSAQEIPNVL